MSIKSQARADYEIPLGRVKPCFTTFFTPSKAAVFGFGYPVKWSWTSTSCG